jgi:hypothetical protein
VAAGGLFLLCLTASSCPCRHGSASDVRRHATPLLGVMTSSSSSDSGPRGEVRKQSRPRVPWEETLSSLKEFKKREGHCNVPQSHKEDGTSLGLWVKNQRQLKRKEKLDPDREEALEDIGFQWGASATWDKMHAMLQEFKKREGHCNVFQSHKEDEHHLGKWANNQRTFKKVGKPDPDRDKLLEEVGFQWRASVTWDEMHPC